MSAEVDSGAELVGHSAGLRYFARALERDRLSSFYLLAGRPGVGKRLLARTCAALALCKNRKAEKPCGTCGECRAVFDGNATRFQEIDFNAMKKANESAVDAARKFILDVEATAGQQRMVWLIPNIQEYSYQVQNSLLKTLEEPPPGALFFATSDRPEFLLGTIESRAQRLPVSELTQEELKQIVRRFEPDEEAVEEAVALCEGSVEKALRFTRPEYREVFDFLDKFESELPADFLTLAEEGLELASRLEGADKQNADRGRAVEFIQIAESRLLTRWTDRVRNHFVALQVFNTLVQELLAVRQVLERGAIVSLAVDHWFSVATSRFAQMRRYLRMKSV